MLQILLDSRYRLVQALNNPSAASGPDPVRLIFLDEWTQLHDAVRAAAQRGMLGARALEFMSFISAGDALFALDQAAPALGVRISAADLRRLAHIMAPTATADPLQFNYGEDRDMKKLFAVPEPPTKSPPNRRRRHPTLHSRRIAKLKQHQHRDAVANAGIHHAIVPLPSKHGVRG